MNYIFIKLFKIYHLQGSVPDKVKKLFSTYDFKLRLKRVLPQMMLSQNHLIIFLFSVSSL